MIGFSSDVEEFNPLLQMRIRYRQKDPALLAMRLHFSMELITFVKRCADCDFYLDYTNN